MLRVATTNKKKYMRVCSRESGTHTRKASRHDAGLFSYTAMQHTRQSGSQRVAHTYNYMCIMDFNQLAALNTHPERGFLVLHVCDLHL